MKKILIVNANYYNAITQSLVKAATSFCKKHKISLSIINVPGVFEIPICIRKNIKNFDGFIALGCVIKGNTPHFDLICKTSFSAIMNLSITFNKPIGNGIITALNRKQALERAGKVKSNKINKGLEAAKAVISILENGTKKI
tara:strand:- start:794 stop:1219 length:426 start_codon:yes stop_codon:yes gene_type:complete